VTPAVSEIRNPNTSGSGFITELESENKRLETELQQIITQRSHRSFAEAEQKSTKEEKLINIQDQADPLPKQDTAEFPTPSSEKHISQIEILKPSYKTVISTKSENQNNISLTQKSLQPHDFNSSRTLKTARSGRNTLIQETSSKNALTMDLEKTGSFAKKCKSAELRLIGAQKTIKALQEANKNKENEINLLKHQLEEKQKMIDTFTNKNIDKSHINAKIKINETKIKQSEIELENSQKTNNDLHRINKKLNEKINEQEILIQKYKKLLESSMQSIPQKEEYFFRF